MAEEFAAPDRNPGGPAVTHQPELAEAVRLRPGRELDPRRSHASARTTSPSASVRHGGRAGHITALACLALLTPFGASSSPAATGATVAAAAAAADSLANPPVLRNASSRAHTVEVTITAAPGRAVLLPGHVTDVWAYNGSVPGPTLEAHEGDRVIVHFHNRLPEATSIHWHGVHVPAGMDGSPLNPVGPGESYDYVFTVPMGSAGTYWYHPHPDGRSAYQVAMGLYAAFIVRPAHDPLAGVPDKVLLLWDNRFRTDGSIDFPKPQSTQSEIDLENGREGNVLFVNGRVMPSVTIGRGEVQRWRVINASAARVYRLAIPGRPLVHVGSDGGLFETPVEEPDVLVANSERVEVLVRGTGQPGDSAMFETLPYDRYMPQTRPADWNTPRALIVVRTTHAPPRAPTPIPAVLRPVPALDTLLSVATHVITMSQGLINGRTMDMTRDDVSARLGTTEIWEVENVVGMDHPFHLHGFEFQMLDRDGVPEPYRSWKDVVNVPKHSVVRLVVRYEDYPGRWMFHCHILDHEDEGMMGILHVH